MINKMKLWELPVLLLLSIGLAACSDGESEEGSESADTVQADHETTDDHTEQASDEAATGEEGEEDGSDEEHIDHQLGLSIGDTATVISSTEEYKYEVTLNGLREREEMEDVPAYDNNKFIVAHVTVKNMDERTMQTTSAIYQPSMGIQDTYEYQVPVGQELLQDISDLELFEGELATGDSITGDYVFRMEDAEHYRFAFGIESDQITTRAEWEFDADEME